MFDDIGYKIKQLAELIFWLLVIACVIGAIVLWTTKVGGYYHYERPYVLHGFAVLIGGTIYAWVFSALLYAFGELVEKTATQTKQNGEIISLLKNMQSTEKTDEKVKAQQTSQISNSHFSFSKLSTDSNHSDLGPWRCEKCGCDNPSIAHYCQGCGDRR